MIKMERLSLIEGQLPPGLVKTFAPNCASFAEAEQSASYYGPREGVVLPLAVDLLMFVPPEVEMAFEEIMEDENEPISCDEVFFFTSGGEQIQKGEFSIGVLDPRVDIDRPALMDERRIFAVIVTRHQEHKQLYVYCVAIIDENDPDEPTVESGRNRYYQAWT